MTENCNFDVCGRKCKFKCYKDFDYCKRHINNSPPKIILERPDECSVCTEGFVDKDKPLICGHYVHRRCLVKWGKELCPICRAFIPLTKREKDEAKNNIVEMNNRYNSEFFNQRTSQHMRFSGEISEEEQLQAFVDQVGLENIFDVSVNDIADMSREIILTRLRYLRIMTHLTT